MVISLIAFLEEISYGTVFSKFRSFFDIKLISIYDKKLDSFHDILDLVKIGISKTITENTEFIGFLVLVGILLIVLLINLFPFIPTGSFYNNFISFIYFLPIGIYYAVIKNDLSK